MLLRGLRAIRPAAAGASPLPQRAAAARTRYRPRPPARGRSSAAASAPCAADAASSTRPRARALQVRPWAWARPAAAWAQFPMPPARGLASAAAPAVLDGTDALNPDGVLVTQRCADRIRRLNAQPAAGTGEGGEGQLQRQQEGALPRYLRVTVDSGGCSGFQYTFEMDDSELTEDDLVFAREDARVVVDDVSLEFLKGATIDFVEEMIRSSFSVANNPNVESGCGCGVSFAPKA